MLRLKVILSYLLVSLFFFISSAANAASFSPSSLTLSPGQKATITVSGATKTVSASSSDYSIVTLVTSSTVSGVATITVSAIKTGSAKVFVKVGGYTIGTVAVTVKSGLTLSKNSLSLSVGQTGTATISNASGTVTASSSNTAVATAVISATTLTVTAKAPGTATITVKDSTRSVQLAVTVTSTVSGNTVGRLLASNCFQCHGTYGEGGSFDKLTGMTGEELYQKLKEFPLDAEHANSIMSAHLAGFTDAQLQVIAYYFANL